MNWFKRTWLRWRRRKTPVVQVQKFEFSFPPTEDSLCIVEKIAGDPQQMVSFWSTNIPHFVTVKIEDDGTMVVTRVGDASEYVEAVVTVVEFNPKYQTVQSEEHIVPDKATLTTLPEPNAKLIGTFETMPEMTKGTSGYVVEWVNDTPDQEAR